MCLQLIHLSATLLSFLSAAYQPSAGSQNYNFESAPEPARQAAAGPPPSAGVCPLLVPIVTI